jgi:hypothetical protein
MTVRAATAALVVSVCMFVAAPPAFAQDTGGVGTVSGTVVSAAGEPELAVTVCLIGTTRCSITDDRGHFKLTDVRPGTYQIELTPPGQPRLPGTTVEVRAGLDSVVELVLPKLGQVRESVTVTASSFVPLEEVKTSGFLLQRTEVLASAGALQDISRYVQALPGVALGAADFRNDLIVRGGSPLENLFIVDNVEIPNINAFANFSSAGGTVSLIDALLLDSVTFLTGGFPAAYGNRVSSVMQVAQREGDRERIRGRATIGFAGSGGVVEGPLAGGRGSWIVSARRSFLDVFTDDIGVGGVPVLYTFNGKVLFDVSPRDRVWGVSVSGKDNIRLGLTEETDPERQLQDFDIRYSGWRTANGFNWQRIFSRGVGLLGVTSSVARVDSQVKDLVRFGVPPADAPVDEVIAGAPVVYSDASTESETTLKYDLTLAVPVLDKIQVGGGFKWLNLDYNTSQPLGVNSPYTTEPGVNAFALQNEFGTTLFGGYAQATTDITSRLNVTWGARVDRFSYLGETRVGPRAGASVRLTDRLSWRVSAGRYYQQPPFLFLVAFPENADLIPLRADHFVTGLTMESSPTTRMSVEVYRKSYGDYPVSSQWDSLSLANVGDTFNVSEVLFPMASRGEGESTGVELLFEKKPGGRWYGQANLSISKARHAGTDGVLRPGSYDYPVILNMDGGAYVTDKVLLSARLSWLGGRPYTPYDETASKAAGYGLYDLARVNAERAIDYFRLDLRVERPFRVSQTELLVYGGVQNITNRRNFAGYYWDVRTESVKFQEQQGIFPILGIDWKF